MDALSYTSGKAGLSLFAVDDPEHRIRYVLALARTIAFLMGAKSHLDEKDVPVYPHGFINVARDSLAIQEYAELMGAYIPNTLGAPVEVTSLDQVRIGPATAYDLGWISRQAYRHYLQSL